MFRYLGKSIFESPSPKNKIHLLRDRLLPALTLVQNNGNGNFKYLKFLVVTIELHSSPTVNIAPFSSGGDSASSLLYFCQEVSKLLRGEKKA